jgi:hypothetical protein
MMTVTEDTVPNFADLPSIYCAQRHGNLALDRISIDSLSQAVSKAESYEECSASQSEIDAPSILGQHFGGVVRLICDPKSYIPTVDYDPQAATSVLYQKEEYGKQRLPQALVCSIPAALEIS